jgi:hypothetical protein
MLRSAALVAFFGAAVLRTMLKHHVSARALDGHPPTAAALKIFARAFGPSTSIPPRCGPAGPRTALGCPDAPWIAGSGGYYRAWDTEWHCLFRKLP